MTVQPVSIALAALAAALGGPAATVVAQAPGRATCSYTWTPGCTSANSGLLNIDFGDIAWRVCIEQRGIKGVWIAFADVRRPNETGYVRVLDGAGPAEIFVPYNAGPFWDPLNPPRLYDMNQWWSPASIAQVSPVDLPAVGLASLETMSGHTVPKVVVECRDLGVSWLDKSPSYPNQARRALEVVAWSVLDTGNYDYIMQYGFRNDGTITFRVGATGFNSPTDPEQGHMHNVLWHIHFNLLGAGQDRVDLIAHAESGVGAVDFSFQLAGEIMYDSSSFLSFFPKLRVSDGSVNYHGHSPGYTVVPAFLEGISRHAEQWTWNDTGVTQWKAGEQGWQTVWADPSTYFVTQPEAVTDPIVWIRTQAYHDPHDEDRSTNDLPCGTTGITNMHWTGVDLKPASFFEYNPVGGQASLSYAPLPANCIGWWKLNDTQPVGSQFVVHDAISNIFGTVNGGVSTQAGKAGGCAVLDGVDDWIAPAAGPNYLDITTGDLTVEAWIQIGSGVFGIGSILEKRVEGVAGYTMFLFSGKLGFQLSSGNTWFTYVSTTAVPTNQFVHVAVAVDRTSSTPQLRMYLNGNQTDTFALGSGPMGSLANAATARIGRHANGAIYFRGLLDELTIYDRALSSGEIQLIAALGAKSGGRP